MIVGLDDWSPACWSIHSPCTLGKVAFVPTLAAVVVFTLPDEEEERREEFGGLELLGEVGDILVVAGITAGSSLSRAAPLLLLGLLRSWSSGSALLDILVLVVVLCKTPYARCFSEYE